MQLEGIASSSALEGVIDPAVELLGPALRDRPPDVEHARDRHTGSIKSEARVRPALPGTRERVAPRLTLPDAGMTAS